MSTFTIYRPDQDNPEQRFAYFDADQFAVEYRFRDETGKEHFFYRCPHCGCPESFRYSRVIGYADGGKEVFRLDGENGEVVNVTGGG